MKYHFLSSNQGADNWAGVLAMVSNASDVVLSLLLVVQSFVKWCSMNCQECLPLMGCVSNQALILPHLVMGGFGINY